MSTLPDIPTYIKDANHENYNEELNQTLQTLLSNNGRPIPSLTAVQIVALEPLAVVGTLWFNTNLAKLVVKTAPGVVETITSV